MALYSEIEVDVWLYILMLLAAEDLQVLMGICRFFKNLIRDTAFLLDHYHTTYELSYKTDLLFCRKGPTFNLLSRHQELKLFVDHGLELIGSTKGLIGLFNGRDVAILNPWVNTYTSITIDHTPHTLSLVGMCFNGRKLQILLCYEDYAVVFDVINGGKWTRIAAVPEFLYDIPEGSCKFPTAFVLDCPYWTYKPKYSKDVTYKSVMFDGCDFIVLPLFKKDNAVFLCMKDVYTAFVFHDSALQVYACVNGDWDCLYTLEGVTNWIGTPMQGFVMGLEYVRQNYDTIQVYDEESNTIRYIELDLPGFINRVYNYTPSMIMWKDVQKAGQKCSAMLEDLDPIMQKIKAMKMKQNIR